jgi:hypothetical protein
VGVGAGAGAARRPASLVTWRVEGELTAGLLAVEKRLLAAAAELQGYLHLGSTHLVGIDEGLAGVKVLAVVVVYHMEVASRVGGGVGGVGPHHLRAAQVGVLIEWCLLGQLVLRTMV